MKKLFFIVILLFLAISLFASEYTVSYVNSSRKDHLQIYHLQNRSYIDIYDLTRVLEANLDINPNLQIIDFTVFNKKCRFFFDNKWVKFGKKNYNLYDNIKIQDGNFYIPKYFLNLCANKFFPDRVVIKNNRIIVNLTTMEQYLIKRIVIDPGHGGKDPGAVGRHIVLKEKDIVLNIAKKVKELLEKNLDVTVLLTREDDRFVSLGDRTDFANNHQADLFISIHCNASYNTKANGTEVYYLSTAQTDEARAVEAMENDAIRFEDPESIKRYSDLDFILYDMRQNEYLIESSELAEMCQGYLVKGLNTKDNGVKQANFYVLKGAFMPAILVEVAFLSNKWEERKLQYRNFQNGAAKSIYETIKEFKKKYDKMN